MDRNPVVGVVEPYDPSIPIGCGTGGLCVEDNHAGIDIGVAEGTPFVSVVRSKIINYRCKGENNCTIVAKALDYPLTIFYAHIVMDERHQVGDIIEQCQILGRAGRVNGSTLLHFEVWKQGLLVDPYDGMLINPSNPSAVYHPLGSLWKGGRDNPLHCPQVIY